MKDLFIKDVEDYETLDGCDRNGEDLMKPFDLKEIQNAFKSCKSKAKPVSGLSPWDLSELEELITEPLIEIFNEALSSGAFPDEW